MCLMGCGNVGGTRTFDDSCNTVNEVCNLAHEVAFLEQDCKDLDLNYGRLNESEAQYEEYQEHAAGAEDET